MLVLLHMDICLCRTKNLSTSATCFYGERLPISQPLDVCDCIPKISAARLEDVSHYDGSICELGHTTELHLQVFL
jgi:hypothetical protein